MNIIKYSALSVLLILTLLFSGCNKIPVPNETIKPPQSSQKPSTMEKYKELLANNSSPAELLKFIKANIGNLTKEDADKAIKALIDAQKKKLENYNEKLFSEDFNRKINDFEKIKTIDNTDNINDNEVKNFLKSAYNDGFKTYESEGGRYLELDYCSIYKSFTGYMTEEFSSYMAIMSSQNQKHYLDDAALTISWDQLAERIIPVEDFIEEFKNSEYQKDMNELYNNYLGTYMIGANNTPAFDYDTNDVNPEVLKSFEFTKTKYPNSKLAKTISEYLDVLKNNKNQKTKEVLKYVGKTTGNTIYGTE